MNENQYPKKKMNSNPPPKIVNYEWKGKFMILRVLAERWEGGKLKIHPLSDEKRKISH